MAAGTRNSTAQGVQKAVRLLACFATSAETSLSVGDLCAMTGWTQSSVYRLLSALERGGLVQQDAATGRYVLGLQLVALAGKALTTNALYTVSRPHLVQLAVASGETANLCVLDGHEVLTVDEVLGTQPIKLSGWVGMRHPLHATAAGKVLLAALPDTDRDILLARGLPPLKPRTITDRACLQRELEQVRSLGHALTVDEFGVGLTGVAAPLRDHADVVAAAIAVGGPSSRLTGRHLEHCIALVKSAAQEASRGLGSRTAA